ncbi:hypothetical protein E2562_037622 [Oryza meyeriana var. granulata]|uniref:Uncharacterized protein n=1 Tax=Oryza meyeriana var. granulata TaxID=110450 RepID=A0A6G1CA30_9ORYZ|nr:hypothetical protein E2562_037622 [Oryza meyeriana var. granulata]
MVNTVAQIEPNRQVSPNEEGPARAEADGKTYAIDKSFQAHHSELAKYLAAFRKAEAHFKGISVQSVPRSEIADVDALAKAAANNEPLPSHVLYEILHGPKAQDMDHNAAPAPVMAITTNPDWRGPIMHILSGRSEGSSGMEARRLHQKARGYRSVSVDLINEARGQAAQNLDHYVTATAAWFNTKLAPHSFAPGDMVLRRALNPGKL